MPTVRRFGKISRVRFKLGVKVRRTFNCSSARHGHTLSIKEIHSRISLGLQRMGALLVPAGLLPSLWILSTL